MSRNEDQTRIRATHPLRFAYLGALHFLPQLARADFKKLTRFEQTRRVLVDFICEIGVEFRLKPRVWHMAVSYLDRILPEVKGRDKILVAITCILLAAKFDENSSNLPRFQEVLEFSQLKNNHNKDVNQTALKHLTSKDILTMEKFIFEKLDYRLFAITPVHLLEYYLIVGVVSYTCGDQVEDLNVVENALALEVREYCKFFLDMILWHVEFQSCPVHHIAAAIIACARHAAGIQPIWSRFLSELTEFPFTGEIILLQERLWEVYAIEWRRRQPIKPDDKLEKDSPQGVSDILFSNQSEGSKKPKFSG